LNACIADDVDAMGANNGPLFDTSVGNAGNPIDGCVPSGVHSAGFVAELDAFIKST
jgi:hypothetical protein